MSVSEATLAQLRLLMEKDEALLARIRNTREISQASALIAEAAAKAGIAVSPADLAEHFAQTAQATTEQGLSDQQLDIVAGGFNASDDSMMIFLSVCTFGIGCAAVSIAHATGNQSGFGKKYC